MSKTVKKFTPGQEAAIRVNGRNVLVSAGAGSGKTATLTERIIRQLTGETEDGKARDIERMLIVTFGRAAAAELKDRISKALSEQLSADPSNEHLRTQMFKLQNAKICTIDSYCYDLVKVHFERLGIGASIRIADEEETEDIKQNAMKAAIEEMYAKEGSLPDADHPFARLEENHFAWFLDMILKGRNDSSLIPDLIKYRENLDNFPEGRSLLSDFKARFEEESRADAFAKTEDGHLLCAFLTQALDHYLNAYAAFAKDFHDMPGCEKIIGLIDTERAQLIGLKQLLLTPDMTPDAFAKACQGFDFIRMPTLSKPEPDVAELKNRFADVREELKKEHIRKWANTYQDMTLEKYRTDMKRDALCCSLLDGLFESYDRRLDAEKRMLGICTFQDITRMALKLLSDEDGNPSDIARTISARFDTVCIDEYQDVTPIQDRIFMLLGEGHRFMVGDMKQAIYAFRGADPSLFNTYRNSYTRYDPSSFEPNQGNDPLCIYLSHNFRCHKPIVSFANGICGTLFRRASEMITYRDDDDLIFGKDVPQTEIQLPVRLAVMESRYDIPKPEKAETADETDEDVQLSDEDSDEAPDPSENAYVRNLVRNLLKTRKPGEIAIIGRTNKQLLAIGRMLNLDGIRTAGGGATDSGNADYNLTVLVNFLTVVDNPHLDDSFFEVMQYMPFGISADELYLIRADHDSRFSLFDAACQYKDAHKEDREEICARLENAIRILSKYRELAFSQSADQFLKTMSQDADLFSLTENASFPIIRDLAHTQQQKGFSSLHAFLPYLEKRIKNLKSDFVQNDSAVSLLTIHQSKGLEFPVVILMGCGLKIQDKDASLNMTFDFETGPAFLFSDDGSGKPYRDIHRMISERVHFRSIVEEELRLLYVALTRAREVLYLTGRPECKRQKLLAFSDIGLLDRYTIAFPGQPSYLSWVLTVTQSRSVPGQDSFFALDLPLSGETKTDPGQEIPALPDFGDAPTHSDLYRHFENVLSDRKELNYPMEVLHNIPKTVAASRLKDDFLDQIREKAGTSGDRSDAALAMLDLFTKGKKGFDEILRDSKKLSAAESGTLVHLFMQFCDYKKLSEFGVEAEIERMKVMAFLTDNQAALLNRSFLEQFRKSDLLAALCHARTVYREYRFTSLTPLSVYTKDELYAASLKDTCIEVRGSLDLLYQDESGNYHLIDYKTDKIPSHLSNDDEISAYFTTLHGEQLRLYADSVKKIFGSFPKSICIYSFPLGRTISLPFIESGDESHG